MQPQTNLAPGAADAMRHRASPDAGLSLCRLALAIAAAAFDVPPEEMRAASRRTAPVADARHVAIYLAHIVFQLPMQTVAAGFGRDRTSVGHAVRRVEDRRDDPAFDERMSRLERLAQCCRAPAEDNHLASGC